MRHEKGHDKRKRQEEDEEGFRQREKKVRENRDWKDIES